MRRNYFKALPNELKPREVMCKASSPRNVDDVSLLAVMLKTGTHGCDVVELSRRLLKAFGSLSRLVRCDWRELAERIKDYNRLHPRERVLGIGKAKQLELAAAFELVRRGFEVKPGDVRGKTVSTSESAHEIFRQSLEMGDEQENFYVLPLDAKNHPISEPVRVTRGTLDGSPVHCREVFKDAIRWGAHAIVVAHNHPSGDATPSREDIAVTRALLDAAIIVGIPLIDHLVLGRDAFISIRESGEVRF